MLYTQYPHQQLQHNSGGGAASYQDDNGTIKKAMDPGSAKQREMMEAQHEAAARNAAHWPQQHGGGHPPNFAAMQMLMNQQHAQMYAQMQAQHHRGPHQPGGMPPSYPQDPNIAALLQHHQLMAAQAAQAQAAAQAAHANPGNSAAASAANQQDTTSTNEMLQVTMPSLTAKEKKSGFPKCCTRTANSAPKVSLGRYRRAWDQLVLRHPSTAGDNDNTNNDKYDKEYVSACFRKILLGQHRTRGWDECRALRKPAAAASSFATNESSDGSSGRGNTGDSKRRGSLPLIKRARYGYHQ